jgi:3-methyladenine DNA glycosylase AlkC
MLLLYIGIHAGTFGYQAHYRQIAQLSTLSNLHVIALSTSPHEVRLRWSEKAMNISYPELLAIDSMGYVYE